MAAGTGVIMMMVGELISSIINAISQQRTNKKNLQQVQATNQMNMDIYQDQKYYNSPQNMIKLLRQAGISPALAYPSMIGGSKGISSPKIETAQFDAPQMESTFMETAQFMLQKKQVDSDLEVKDATVNKLKADRMKTLQDVRTASIRNEIEQATKEGNIKKVRLLNEELENNITLIRETTNKLMQDIYQQAERFPAEMQERRQNIELINANISKVVAETENEVERNALIQSQIKAQNLDNQLKDILLKYQDAKSSLENQKMRAEVNRIFQEIKILKESEKNAMIKNYIDYVEAFYRGEYLSTTVRNMKTSSNLDKIRTANDLFKTLLDIPQKLTPQQNQKK